ncbi:hypothetical protein EV424DRAFT_1349355 [Suillus variegatus]|nr:hypothetical protein EV424DRAFT_1349355 [Suillus variegatus]
MVNCSPTIKITHYFQEVKVIVQNFLDYTMAVVVYAIIYNREHVVESHQISKDIPKPLLPSKRGLAVTAQKLPPLAHQVLDFQDWIPRSISVVKAKPEINLLVLVDTHSNYKNNSGSLRVVMSPLEPGIMKAVYKYEGYQRDDFASL